MLDTVRVTRGRSRWNVRRILQHLGLAVSLYYEWCKRARAARLEDRLPQSAPRERLLPEEVQAICTYALEHPREGYRRLAWMMVDEHVAYASPASVYAVLKDADLLYRWKRSSRAGTKPQPPCRPHQRWHTDLMYLWIEGRWCYLCTVLDGYSRYIVHWELLTAMTADQVALVAQAALEKVPGAQPEIVHDQGAQFKSRDFRQIVRHFQAKQIFIRVAHPESNGVLERYHRSTREALDALQLRNYSQACERIAAWVAYYNERRLHAGLRYLQPVDYYAGDPEARLQQRREKLAAARQHRRRENGRRVAA